MSRVLVVGEALMDVVTVVDKGTRRRSEHPGGSPANVALGLSRLGVETDFLTSLAIDTAGLAIAQHLRDSGVQIVPESFNAHQTSHATATIGTNGAASYEFDISWHITNTFDIPPVDIIHTGSIAAFLQPGGEQVRQIVQNAPPSSLVSFVPTFGPD
ncbi:PfkB family carbohydrate kinase [Subtercola boreus]|uniref:PfkB family carbohydrate kinase n=1 Tax=Subtercola boreus TaxID=120213 RepID=UPI00209BC90A|nr:PfkB family carbohydrate kinase [Subtercola boreus]